MTKKDITSFLTKRKHRASSYPPLNENTVKCILQIVPLFLGLKENLLVVKPHFPLLPFSCMQSRLWQVWASVLSWDKLGLMES